jgi:hypothetical protein
VPKSLGDMVRDKIDGGVLPLIGPVKLWAGNGSGKACAACQQIILPSQTEYEPQYDDGRPPILLHVGCHGMWEAERRRRGYLPDD